MKPYVEQPQEKRNPTPGEWVLATGMVGFAIVAASLDISRKNALDHVSRLQAEAAELGYAEFASTSSTNATLTEFRWIKKD